MPNPLHGMQRKQGAGLCSRTLVYDQGLDRRYRNFERRMDSKDWHLICPESGGGARKRLSFSEVQRQTPSQQLHASLHGGMEKSNDLGTLNHV